MYLPSFAVQKLWCAKVFYIADPSALSSHIGVPDVVTSGRSISRLLSTEMRKKTDLALHAGKRVMNVYKATIGNRCVGYKKHDKLPVLRRMSIFRRQNKPSEWHMKRNTDLYREIPGHNRARQKKKLNIYSLQRQFCFEHLTFKLENDVVAEKVTFRLRIICF